MNIRYIISLVMLVIGGGIVWTASHYHSAYIKQKQHADDAIQKLNQANATITDIQKRQGKLTALDKTHTEALNNAESENDTLRRQLTSGARRVYIRGNCPVSGTGKAHAPASMDNDTAVELSGTTGQTVFDLRAGIIRDQAKLKFLQQYIEQQTQQ